MKFVGKRTIRKYMVSLYALCGVNCLFVKSMWIQNIHIDSSVSKAPRNFLKHARTFITIVVRISQIAIVLYYYNVLTKQAFENPFGFRGLLWRALVFYFRQGTEDVRKLTYRKQCMYVP